MIRKLHPVRQLKPFARIQRGYAPRGSSANALGVFVNREQKRYLQVLIEIQDQENISRFLFIKSWKIFLTYACMFIAGITLFPNEFGSILAGVSAGLAFSLFRFLKLESKIWPTSRQIIDWDKPKELLKHLDP